MYVTRRLSEYRASPDAALAPAPPGPWSGYLVVHDEGFEAEARCCFGACRDPYLPAGLPFPQDRRVTVEYTEYHGEGSITYCDSAVFLPLPGQPLATGRYYVVIGSGKHKGKVSTCSTTDDMTTFCFCRCLSDAKPTLFDHTNVHQQVEVTPYKCKLFGSLCGGQFQGKAVAPDAFPQRFLRRRGWKARTSAKPAAPLGEAPGINETLRTGTPDISAIIGSGGATVTPPVEVGRWYVPFVFVREGSQPVKEQMKASMYYVVVLEHFWEVVFETQYGMVGGNSVTVNVEVQTESALLSGITPARLEDAGFTCGFKWFRPAKVDGEGLGLSAAVVEQMKWEQARGGWVEGGGRVQKTEVFVGASSFWSTFKCCALVERFVVRRLDGSLVLTWAFTHANKTRGLWFV